jgi:hypothetical protein
MSHLGQESINAWCGNFHPLVVKDMCEIINNSLVIIFKLLLQIKPKNKG